MRKTIAAMVLLAALCASAVSALAEIGFAEIRMDNVNVRKSPGGNTRWQLDQGASVYVYEETQRGDTRWCHVYTNAGGKEPVSGWIRSDMLRYVSEEFTNVVSVEAGDQYVTGVRADGTVAIIGWDMAHLPCIDTVRSWKNVRQTISEICTVFGLDKNGNVLHVGRFGDCEGEKAAKLTGSEAILLDADGRFTAYTRSRFAQYGLADGLLNGCYQEAFYTQNHLHLLTADGKVYSGDMHFGGTDGFIELFDDGLRTTDIDIYWYHMLALKEDGTVRAWGAEGRHADGVDGWTDVVKVAAGEGFSMGLRSDGTVYYAGDDKAFAKRVAGWSGVTDIDAGYGFCIALFDDGHVEMAGTFTSYDR